MSFVRKFQKGDTVFHRPTGETWSLIEDEHAGYVTPGGWPASQKLVVDPEQREAAIAADVFNPAESDRQYYERRLRELRSVPTRDEPGLPRY